MVYTLEHGARGWKIPQRYTLEKGAQRQLTPDAWLASVPLNEIELPELAKYAAVPIVSVALLMTLLQFMHISAPQGHQTGQGSPQTGVPTVRVLPAATVAPSSSSSNDSRPQTTISSRVNNTAPTNTTVNSSPVTTPPSTSDNSSLLPISTPVDPIITPIVSGDGGTTPTDPAPTPDPSDSSTSTDPVTVNTPVAQVGVDVFPPSVNLGLQP